MVQDIDKGASLSDALMNRKLPDLYTSMVKAGEIGGSLRGSPANVLQLFLNFN